MEAERIGDQLVVHNYGHGGSGWSLSWGAAEATVRTVLTAVPTTREIAVIGCGALGLTAALTAQRAGLNVASYSRQLLADFLLAGGRIETREFHTPSQLSALPQRVLLNCTGYGARQLWADESLVPVRGQIAWLIPQEDVHYGLRYGALNVLGRRDDTGWNDPNEQPDRAEAEAGVRQLQQLYAHTAAIPQTVRG